ALCCAAAGRNWERRPGRPTRQSAARYDKEMEKYRFQVVKNLAIDADRPRYRALGKTSTIAPTAVADTLPRSVSRLAVALPSRDVGDSPAGVAMVRGS